MALRRALFLALVVTIVLMAANGVTQGAALQGVAPAPIGDDGTFGVVRYAVSQGGLFGIALVLAIMLYKVWERAGEREDKVNAALLEVAKSQTKQADATEEFTNVVRSCKTAQQFSQAHLNRKAD